MSEAPPRARDTLNRRLLVLADVLSGMLAFALADMITGSAAGPKFLIAGVAIVLFDKTSGLYDRDELLLRKSTLEEVPSLLASTTTIVFASFLASAFIDGRGPGDGQLGLQWALLAGGLVLGRTAARAVARHVAAPERCLVLGDRSRVDVVRAKLATARGVEVVGCVPLGVGGAAGLADTGDLHALVRELDVHRIVVAPTSDDDGTAV